MKQCEICKKEIHAFYEYIAKKENGIWLRYHPECKKKEELH